MEKFFFICVGEKQTNKEDKAKFLEKITEATNNGSIRIFSSPDDKAIEFAEIIKRELDVRYKINNDLNLPEIYFPFIKIPILQKFINKHQSDADCLCLITYYQHSQFPLSLLKNEYLKNNKYYFPVDSPWECQQI